MYFKIFSHRGFPYEEGIRIDTNSLYASGVDGDLSFTDEKNVMHYCVYGDKIAEITIPEGERIIKTVSGSYWAHSLIIGKIRDLWTAETFEYLKEYGVNFHKSDHSILAWQ